MKVADLIQALRQETPRRAYIGRLEMLDQSGNLLKARLDILPELAARIGRRLPGGTHWGKCIPPFGENVSLRKT